MGHHRRLGSVLAKLLHETGEMSAHAYIIAGALSATCKAATYLAVTTSRMRG
jgi:hypothetical protein